MVACKVQTEAMMNEKPIDDDHNPETAFFWASFATEDEQLQKDCPTERLYRNSNGEFFSVKYPPPGKDPMFMVLVKDPWKWLQEEIKRLKGNMP